MGLRPSNLVVLTLLACLTWVSVGGGVASNARADSITTAVALYPAAINLAAGDRSTVDLIFTNASAVPVQITEFELRTPPRITAQLAAPVTGEIVAAGAYFRATFDLRAAAGVGEGAVTAVVVSVPADGSPVQTSIAAGKIDVEMLDVLVAPILEFTASPEQLNDGQTRYGILRISNPTPFTFRTVRVEAFDSDDVTLSAPLLTGGFDECSAQRQTSAGHPLACLDALEPGDAQLLRVAVTAAADVRVGKQLLTAVATADRLGQRDGDGVSVSAPATFEVDLTIFGLDALSPFGLSTLFLLPGLLAVIMFLLLARLYPRNFKLPDTVELKDPRLLPFVILVGILVYAAIFFTFGRNLTESAGTWDVVLLFWAGLIVGAAGWGALAVVWYVRSGRKQFTANDSPEKVLKRLSARDARLRLPAVVVDSLDYRYLGVGPDASAFVCPPITYEFPADADEATRQAFRRELRANRIDAIRRLADTGEVTLCWDAPSGVRTVPANSLQLSGSSHLLGEAERQA